MTPASNAQVRYKRVTWDCQVHLLG